MADLDEQERAEERARAREAHMRMQQQEQEQEKPQEPRSLADEPAPDLSDIQPERKGGMERELRLGGAPQETAQWKVDGMQLAADLQASGFRPYAQEQQEPRSLADEPAPDLSDLDKQIEEAEMQVQQQNHEHEQEQEINR